MLLLLCSLQLAGAREIELSADYQIPAGRGVALLSFNASGPGPGLPGTFLVHWRIPGKHQERDFFVYGKEWIKDRGPDLVEKFGLAYGGRLVALELPAGKYILDDIQITGVMQNKQSDGKINSAFVVEAGRVRYLGHLHVDVTDTAFRAGTIVGILLLGADMGGFSARLSVTDKGSDMERIVTAHAPQLMESFDVALLSPSLVSRDVHPLLEYPASGYAEINDVAALPQASDNCKARYADWLTRKSPKAFAVAKNGGCSFTWGTRPVEQDDSPVPAERAIAVCLRRYTECGLYAVDDRVVYSNRN